jgi:SAM-dependent methyltransferase
MATKAKNKKKKSKKGAPAPREVSEETVRSLEKLYKGGKARWVDAEEEVFEGIETTNPDHSASVYGEITMMGVSSVIRKFSKLFQDPECVFYDLGCGLGRMAGQVALLTNAKKSVGVELCPNRFAAAKELADSIDWVATKPTFIQGDFLDQDYSDATVVYIDNTMYLPEVLDKVISMLPEDCMVIYQAQWISVGDPVFSVETTYNRKPLPEGTEKLFKYTYTHAAWRRAKGHEF